MAKRDKPLHPPLILYNSIIEDVMVHEHLGLTLSSNSSWREHISKIHQKASKKLNLLKPLKYNLSRCTLLFFKFYSNPCSFNKRSFHPSPMFRIYHIIAETTKISQAASFLYKFEICKFATFGHWWSRNFSPCKGESGVHRFFNFHDILFT